MPEDLHCEEMYAREIATAGRFNSENDNKSNEDIYVNEDNLQTHSTISDQNKNSGCVTAGVYRWTTVGLLLICVLLLAVIVVFIIKYDQLQTSYKNLTIEKDHLQSSYKDLTIKSNQLQRENDEYKSLVSYLDQGWIYFQSSVYTITNEPKGWTESRQSCENKGADLVVIKSQEEQMFISRGFPKTPAWIGANDIGHEGTFMWVDGTVLNTGFWADKEPSNYGGNENCAETGFTDSPLKSWNDARCDYSYVGICEKRL